MKTSFYSSLSLNFLLESNNEIQPSGKQNTCTKNNIEFESNTIIIAVRMSQAFGSSSPWEKTGRPN